MIHALCSSRTLVELQRVLAGPRRAMLREVVDLNDGAWVKVLNVLDSCLEAVLRSHPRLVALWDADGPPKPRTPPAEARAITEAISQAQTTPTKSLSLRHFLNSLSLFC